MKWTTKQLTLCGVLTALALALSYMENLFPLTVAIPLPGVKLGLANIVTVFALYALGTAPAFLILIARCLLGALVGDQQPGDAGTRETAAGLLCALMEATHLIWS